MFAHVSRAALQRRLLQLRSRRAPAEADPHETAAQGVAGTGQALPHLAQIQSSFGHHDVSGARAFVGGPAAQASEALGAEAYATGDAVAFRGAPDLHTAAHEAAHVVQQRAGVQLAGGVGQEGDAYERHADQVADAVVRGQPAGTLLDQLAPAGGAAPVQRALQRSPVKTSFGEFKDDTYTDVTNGVDIVLKFSPGATVDAKAIGLSQSVKDYSEGKSSSIDPNDEQKLVTSGPGSGYQIDRISQRNNPIYGSDDLASGDGLDKTKPTNAPTGATPSTSNATYEMGHRFTDSGTLKTKDAWMHDRPTGGSKQDSGMEFETVAMAVDGAQKGTYYGSVRWGWKRDGAGTFSRIPLTLASQGVPTQNFLAPAEQWNSGHARGTIAARADHTKVYNSSLAVAFELDRGVKVKILGAVASGSERYNQIEVLEGPHLGDNGYVKIADLKDQGDGAATADLPIPDVHTIDASDVELNKGVPGPWRNKDPLPRGTRVVPKPGDTKKVTTTTFPIEQIDAVWVDVADGPLTGHGGYVPKTALKDEKP